LGAELVVEQKEAYAKLGDEPCEQVSDLRERYLLIMLFKGFA
jgi:hypothetical protein